MTIFEDFHSRRSAGNESVMSQDFLPYKRFYNLDTNAYSDGSVPQKYKELTGLACSLLLRCNDCVLYHLENCFNLGADKNEINETMNIALVIGGSIVIPHLRFATQALEELERNK
jgi:AhpD family alkylhydroperoxidase